MGGKFRPVPLHFHVLRRPTTYSHFDVLTTGECYPICLRTWSHGWLQTSPSSSSKTSNSEPSSPRVPRRTVMACQFCRGRKLKCDGMRPSCKNCNQRGIVCSYVPV
ncbi:hypothetical protein PILCRDRAFT_71395 [Piloderma croceum F 1598]|uniref:Zn(2)-C6 fungal-type domain-containing protein n=1 Tax=Piloderma croceum (strain F 1598) TaxID=765440 RepID=A0A0C3FS70_PILCF|nr:hypothetical protein PILCRDRAFT_71395 [Piloderma croceum F 1598]